MDGTMRFVKIVNSQGETIYVNPEEVVALERNPSGNTTIITTAQQQEKNGSYRISCKGTVEDIARILEGGPHPYVSRSLIGEQS
jgi:hypothetical protein